MILKNLLFIIYNIYLYNMVESTKKLMKAVVLTAPGEFEYRSDLK